MPSPLPPPRFLLFDMDGVLVDVRGSYRQTIVETAARFGVRVTAEDVDRRKQAGDAANDWIVTRDLLRAAGVDVPFDEIVRVFEALYEGTPERPGLCARETMLVDRGLLLRWSRRWALGVVTGRPRAQARAALERWRLSQAFGAMVCMGETAPKPSAEPVEAALEQLGAPRAGQQAWMFGDTPDDVVAARTAGVVPIGVTWGAARPGHVAVALRRAGAVRIARSPGEVDGWLQETLRGG